MPIIRLNTLTVTTTSPICFIYPYSMESTTVKGKYLELYGIYLIIKSFSLTLLLLGMPLTYFIYKC